MSLIDYQDWLQAKKQLKLVIRDYHIYNSNARYYDVKNFIWERIQNQNYSFSWKVEWERYQKKIERSHFYYKHANISLTFNRRSYQRVTAIRQETQSVTRTCRSSVRYQFYSHSKRFSVR